MHELGLAQEVVRVVEAAAARAGARRVLSVRVRAGRLMQVEPDTLTFLLAVVGRASPVAQDASFRLEIVPVRLACRRCGHAWEMGDWAFACPRCGSTALDTLSGDGLEVVDMEVDMNDARGHP